MVEPASMKEDSVLKGLKNGTGVVRVFLEECAFIFIRKC